MVRVLLYLSISLLLFSCKKEDSKTPKGSQPPNVVIIFTDDQGYQDVGCFGSPNIETPNLDRMASEGLRLTDFYAAEAVCSASRAGLLTGCYPNRIGIFGALFPHSKHGLNPSEMTIAEMLKARGYSTAIYGKWHLGDAPEFNPTRHGFDEYTGILFSNDMWSHHPDQACLNMDPLMLYENEEVIDTIDDQSMLTTLFTKKSTDFISRNKSKPFFLYLAHPQPHVPLFVSDKFKGKSAKGLYGDVIMEIDWSVGQILSTLKKEGLDDNTIVIFTSDNGPWLQYGSHSGSALPLREGKGTAWEGGQREPCIIRFPKKLPAGRDINTPMMNIDILPTIAEITGAELPLAKIDGKSLWSVWTGLSNQGPQQAYYFYYNTNELHGIRYKNWKLYYPHTYRTLNGREGGRDGLPVPYEYKTLATIELYNLEEDVSETNNVADKHPEVIEEIEALARNIREELGDNLQGKPQGIGNRPVGKVE